MENYFDYKKNEIKDGMTIQHVKIKEPAFTLRGSGNPNAVLQVPERDVFIVICEYKVEYNKKHKILFTSTINTEKTISQSLDMLMRQINSNTCCVIIKDNTKN
jgi:hypothetical protein